MLNAVNPRLRGTLAALEARQIAAPLTCELLLAVVEQWTETAQTLTHRDLRLRERLARAQVRKAGDVTDDGAVAKIERLELDTARGEERTGIWRSISTRSTASAVSRARACLPSVASMTSSPSERSLSRLARQRWTALHSS